MIPSPPDQIRVRVRAVRDRVRVGVGVMVTVTVTVTVRPALGVALRVRFRVGVGVSKFLSDARGWVRVKLRVCPLVKSGFNARGKVGIRKVGVRKVGVSFRLRFECIPLTAHRACMGGGMHNWHVRQICMHPLSALLRRESEN